MSIEEKQLIYLEQIRDLLILLIELNGKNSLEREEQIINKAREIRGFFINFVEDK